MGYNVQMSAKIHRMPAYLADLPPPAAGRLETARRAVLDWLFAHDYQLHIPPLAEHVETLDGGDESLRLDIFQMTDTLSGRILGIRADHTPQIARYDAAKSAANGTTAGERLAYCGPALRTLPAQPWKLREVMQAGAELFNAESPAADWEIIRLAAGALQAAGLSDIAIDIGHAGVLRALLQTGGGIESERKSAESAATTESTESAAITESTESAADIAALCRHASRHDEAVLRQRTPAADAVLALLSTHGDSAIEDARRITSAAGVDANAMLDDLATILQQLRDEGFDAAINFAEIGGYGYHTGTVFSIVGSDFVAARGGRYARVGFRTAVGFSMDLREVVEHLSPLSPPPPPVLCPLAPQDSEWQQAVNLLRTQGRRLRFVEQAQTPPLLEKRGDVWQVRES